jgi:ABC-2 type transport system permease protein
VIAAILTGVRLHMKQASRNPFDLSGVVVWPILYASIAYYLLDAKHSPKLLLSASLGAAVMLMWSLVVIASSGVLEQQRWQGTLELVVAAPRPLNAVIAPICVAGALVGCYGIAATLVWGAVLFDVPVHIEHPLAFAVAIPAGALAVGMLGLIMAATFVLYRAAFHLGIATQYPPSSVRSRGCSPRRGASAGCKRRRSAERRGQTSACASCSASPTSQSGGRASSPSNTSPARAGACG